LKQGQKWILTAIVLGLALLVGTNALDEQGKAYIDRVFKQALATFAIARTLNGIISVAKGTKLAIEPAGVGMNFALGEVLDPINDLVEGFSWVMLASTTSLGIQKVLLEMAGWWGIRLLLLGSVLLFLARLWWPPFSRWSGSRWVDKGLLVVLFLNLAVPTVAAFSNQIFVHFLEATQQASVRALEKESGEFRQVGETLPLQEIKPAEKTWREKLAGVMGGVRDSLNFEEEIRQLQAKSEEIAGHVIDLIVVFVLQTILLPLGLLWLLLRLVKLKD
jgi:hypothetical protein